MNVIKCCVIILSIFFGLMLIGLSVSEIKKDNIPGFVGMFLMALTYFMGIAFMS